MIKLDHNPIGDDGALILAQSLGYNPDVNLLSLTYCEIGSLGAEGLFEIIIYQNSKMVELALTGNPLKDEGIIKIFTGLAAAKALNSVYLSDCQWEDTEPVLASLEMAMKNNTTLGKYDLKHNTISEEGIEKIVEILGQANHVNTVTMSEFISEGAMNMLTEALAANKPAKGKKGKKKK